LEEAAARPPEFFAGEIERQASSFDLDLPPSAVAGLAAYLAQLDLWRRRTNLTGPMTAGALATHALESALGASLISHGARVIDIGSGSGMPGVPLAVTRPDVSMTLLEPRAKRAAFLQHVIRSAPVPNATLRRARAAELEADGFEAATVRAVGNLQDVVQKGLFLKNRGALLVWTTRPEEIAGPLEAWFELERIKPVPGSREKVIVLLTKKEV